MLVNYFRATKTDKKIFDIGINYVFVDLKASIVRQMKDSEMAMQWTLIYQLTSRLRVLLQSAPSKRLLFEYSTTSQD